MNDIELLARLRKEVPLARVSPRAERLFRAGLETQGAAGTRRRRPAALDLVRTARPAWRLVLAGGLAAVLAAGAMAAAGLNSRAAAPSPGTLSVAELAYRTSAAAARQPDVRPGQWVYREYAGVGGSLVGLGFLPLPSPAVRWATADDRVSAFYYHGRLVVGPWIGCCVDTWFGKRPSTAPILGPPVSFASLGSLSADPRELLALLRRMGPLLPGDSTFPPHLRALQVIGILLSSYVMPPRVTAELYRALGDIPGVTVDDHAVDVAGQPGIGFLLRVPASGYGTQVEIVVNRRTYQFMGYQVAGRGTHLEGYAVVRQALVSGPGVRP
jgi:hypothetical protein